jgi:hypothetical protein
LDADIKMKVAIFLKMVFAAGNTKEPGGMSDRLQPKASIHQ